MQNKAILPKLTYSKVIQSLKKLQQHWEQDRKENPVPYEIDTSLRRAIETAMRETNVTGPNQYKQNMVDETIEYLYHKGIIIKSPYGGHYFPLPPGTQLPTKEQLIKATTDKINQQFFGKPKDFTD